MRCWGKVPFTFGADGAQLFDTKQHGSLVAGLKVLGLQPEDASKNEVWAPYMVVNGPTEPHTLEHILAPLVQFFVNHDPGVSVAPLETRLRHHWSL